jgi:hypothetical protein
MKHYFTRNVVFISYGITGCMFLNIGYLMAFSPQGTIGQLLKWLGIFWMLAISVVGYIGSPEVAPNQKKAHLIMILVGMLMCFIGLTRIIK